MKGFLRPLLAKKEDGSRGTESKPPAGEEGQRVPGLQSLQVSFTRQVVGRG